MARRTQTGFTLIEVMVAILLMAIITTVAMVELRQSNQLEDTANGITAAGRALFDEAAVKHLTLRLAYDLDQGAYWIEAYDGTYQISGVQRDNDDVRREAEEKKAEIDRLKAKYGTESPQAAGNEKEFVQVDAIGFAESEVLPPRIRIAQVETPQLREPVKKGKAYTHFFPGGFAEPTLVVLVDTHGTDDRSDDEYLTLEFEPLTGLVVQHEGLKTREQLDRERRS